LNLRVKNHMLLTQEFLTKQILNFRIALTGWDDGQSGHWITCVQNHSGARQRNALILRRALDALPLCQNHMNKKARRLPKGAARSEAILTRLEDNLAGELDDSSGRQTSEE
jgi:hypothetical protein